MTCLFETKNSFKLTIQTLLTTATGWKMHFYSRMWGFFSFTGPTRVDLHLFSPYFLLRMSFTSSYRRSGSRGTSPVIRTVTSWSLPSRTRVSSTPMSSIWIPSRNVILYTLKDGWASRFILHVTDLTPDFKFPSLLPGCNAVFSTVWQFMMVTKWDLL